jgi:HSP20 family molecular chaperone IbpA
MNMILKSSFSPRRVDLFGELTKEVDRAVNEVFGAPFFTGKRGKGYPLMDAVRTNDSLIIQYTVPGVKKEDLSVEIEEEGLTTLLVVGGKLSKTYQHEENSYHIKELSSQEFRRVIKLPEDISTDPPKTSLQDGILTITFGLVKKIEEPVNKVKRLSID